MKYCSRNMIPPIKGTLACFALFLFCSSACHRVSGNDSDGSDATSDRDTKLNDTASSAGTDTATETAMNPCDVVTFKDPNFEAYMRDRLDIPSGPIRGSDMSSLGGFSIHDDLGIRDISGIECAKDVYTLTMTNNPLESIAPLEFLPNLEDLRLEDSEVSDLSALSAFSDFLNLRIPNNKVVSVEPLAGIHFQFLVLDGNPITDVTPLSRCEISSLSISGSGLTELPSLAEMELDALIAYDNAFTDLTPLSHATKKLFDVNLRSNRISDLTPLADPGFAGADYLALDSNLITDLSPLLDAEWLSGTRLYIKDNPLSLESASEILPMLCEIAIYISWGDIEGAPEEGWCGYPPNT
jgi:Leucine-rich repeat (LRR) protein